MSGEALRFALRYNPAVIACEFRDTDGEVNTLKINFSNLKEGTDAGEVLELVQAKLKTVVTVDDIDPGQLQALVLKLIAGCATSSLTAETDHSNRAQTKVSDGTDELPADLRAAMGLDEPEPEPEPVESSTSKYLGLTLPGGKSAMGLSGALNQATNGEDQKSKKKAPVRRIERSETEGFDDLLTDLLGEDIDSPLSKEDRAAARSRASTSSPRRSVASQQAAMASVAEPVEEEEEDLNKVSDFRLRVAKKRMDETFEKNLIRPGMEGYEYDKPVEFEAEEDASWDSD